MLGQTGISGLHEWLGCRESQGRDPIVHLLFGLVLCEAITGLKLADEKVTTAADRCHVIVAQSAPVRLCDALIFRPQA